MVHSRLKECVLFPTVAVPTFTDQLSRKDDSDEEVASEEDSESEIELTDDESEEELEAAKPAAYDELLKILGPEIKKKEASDERKRKKRRTEGEREEGGGKRRKKADDMADAPVIEETMLEGDEVEPENEDDSEAEQAVEKGNQESNDSDEDSDNENDKNSADPFKLHFADPSEEYLRRIESAKKDEWRNSKSTVLLPTGETLRILKSYPNAAPVDSEPAKITASKDLHLKDRLLNPFDSTNGPLTDLQCSVATPLFNNNDLLFTPRTISNAEQLRHLYCLHALNLVQKTRDRVLRNSVKLARNPDTDIELRDQGYTRLKVLILLPTRNACAKVVDALVSIFNPEQQENKKRFNESYRLPPDTVDPLESSKKPEDFKELFAGNHDDAFRLGIKFTRKTIKFFSGFYKSDILIASPLGLRTIIEDPKKPDYDFLSSIELVVLDQADALIQQNWDHVDKIYSHLNLLPRESHGCDFSRVRNWYLDQAAAYMRQNVIISSFLTPELNSLWNTHMRNISGRVKISPRYDGTLTSFTAPIRQTFLRFPSPHPSTDPDSRFTFFTASFLPTLLRKHPSHTLLFVPSTFDFIRLRNHLSTSTSASFTCIAEDTPNNEIVRARAHFLSGRYSLLVYSGRAHHFRRFFIKGVHRVVMYQVPENNDFYREVGEMMAVSGQAGAEVHGITSIFSKWDGLALERIVGTGRVGGLLKEGKADTFEFM